MSKIEKIIFVNFVRMSQNVKVLKFSKAIDVSVEQMRVNETNEWKVKVPLPFKKHIALQHQTTHLLGQFSPSKAIAPLICCCYSVTPKKVDAYPPIIEIFRRRFVLNCVTGAAELFQPHSSLNLTEEIQFLRLTWCDIPFVVGLWKQIEGLKKIERDGTQETNTKR